MNSTDKKTIFIEIEQNRIAYNNFLDEVKNVEDSYYKSLIEKNENYERLKKLYHEKEELDKKWKELHDELNNLIRG